MRVALTIVLLLTCAPALAGPLSEASALARARAQRAELEELRAQVASLSDAVAVLRDRNAELVEQLEAAERPEDEPPRSTSVGYHGPTGNVRADVRPNERWAWEQHVAEHLGVPRSRLGGWSQDDLQRCHDACHSGISLAAIRAGCVFSGGSSQSPGPVVCRYRVGGCSRCR